MSKSVAPPERTSSDRRRSYRRRRPTNPRAFMVLMSVACLALGVAGVASVVSGGYRPECYEGGVDPVRAAALLSFGAMAAGFALAATTALRSFWSERRVAEITIVAFLSGLTVMAVAGFLFFATIPDSSAPLVSRSSIQILAQLGLGLVVAGLVPAVLKGVPAAVKRRNPNLLIILVALALIIVIRLVWRG